MEYIPGETLQQRPRPGRSATRTCRKCCASAGRSPRGWPPPTSATDLIHRDIKPGNVLLEGGQHKAKITDFGLKRVRPTTPAFRRAGIIAGTPMYMAPEQAQGQTLRPAGRPVQPRQRKLLSNAVCRAGRRFLCEHHGRGTRSLAAEDTPRPIREIIPETPEWLCDIIAKLHAKDPDDRYQSGAWNVADVLANCEAQVKAHLEAEGLQPHSRSEPQRSGLHDRVSAAAAGQVPQRLCCCCL